MLLLISSFLEPKAYLALAIVNTGDNWVVLQSKVRAQW